MSNGWVLPIVLPVGLSAAVCAVLADRWWRGHQERKREARERALFQCAPCDPKQQAAKSEVERLHDESSVCTPSDGVVLLSECTGFSHSQEATVGRKDYIGWHDYFMSVAVLSAYRSKDPNRQVGACIVDPSSMRIVGIGYNGFPWGCSDEELPWARSAPSQLDTKYPYVCHAELNAISNKNSSDLRGCRMYVTLFPCNECAKLIIQSRMAEVIFLSDKYHDTMSMQASRRMLKMAGVKFWEHTPKSRRVLIDFESAAR